VSKESHSGADERGPGEARVRDAAKGRVGKLPLSPMAKKPTYTARTADKHELYQLAVQAPEAEVEFVGKNFKRLRGRPARLVREDFCGTAYSSCGWVAAHPENRAVGVDLHKPTLSWGEKHNLSKLTAEQRSRVTLLARDVRSPNAAASGVDAVLAMNFSYWIFSTREGLRDYFKSVLGSLAKDGVFFLDHYGGYDAFREYEENRKLKGFTYVWDQAHYDPITGNKVCHIHFKFPDGTKMHRAFSYTWRLWTLPEIQEVLHEAGFKNVTVFWEGADGKGGGNGVFKPAKKGDADASYICYLAAYS